MAHSASSQAGKGPRTGKNVFVSPTPMANSANKSLTTPLSYTEKCVCLEEWWLVKVESDGKRLAVGGLTSRGHQAKRVFHSSPIVKRNDAYTLETTDGITIIIQGLINKARSHENGFPPEACNKFLTGFPLNWEVYADQYLGKASVSAQTSSSHLDKISTSPADCGSSDPPICIDELPISRVLDCFIATHGSSNNDMARGDSCTKILGNCSANASRDSTLQGDLDMRKVIPFLKAACLLEETPSKHEMLSGDWKGGNVSEDNQCSKNTKNSGQEEYRKELLSKQPANFNHRSCGDCMDELFQGNNHMDKSNLSIDASNQCSLQTAKRIISPCKVRKDILKETLNKHEMKRTSNLFSISKSINSDMEGSCLSEKVASNSCKFGYTGIQNKFFVKESDISCLKCGKNDDKELKNNLKGGSMDSGSFSLSGCYALDSVNRTTKTLCKLNNSDTADVEKVIVQEPYSVDTNDLLQNDFEETTNCTHGDMNSPALQRGDIIKPAPPLLGVGMQKETLTRGTFRRSTARASTRLRNLRNNQKKNQTCDNTVNSANALSSSSFACVSQNDGSGYKLNAGSDSNVLNLHPLEVEKDLFVTERDDGFQEYEKYSENEILTARLLMTKTEFCTSVTSEVTLPTCDEEKDDAVLSKRELNVLLERSSEFEVRRSCRRFKDAKENLQERQATTENVGIQKNEVSTGTCVAIKSSNELEKNEENPRECAKVIPESRGNLTEIYDKHLERGQEPRNASLQRNLSTAKASLKCKVQACSDGKSVTPSKEKGETSDGFLCTYHSRRSSSRLKHSKDKQNQDSKTNNCPQIGKGEDILSNEAMNIENNSSGGASDLDKVAFENRVSESSQGVVGSGQRKCGAQLDCLSSQHGVDSNVQKGLNTSVKMLKRKYEKKGFTRKRNVMQSSSSSKPYPYASQSLITRNRAKKLSFASPESLNFKRSRSGRLLVPPLQNWRNEQIVYDSDGVITGITLGYDRTLSASGNKQGGDSAVQQKHK